MTTDALRQLNDLIELAHEQGASDLFCLPGEPPALRLAGELERLERPPLEREEIEAMARDVVGEEQLRRIGPHTGVHSRYYGTPGEINTRINLARSMGRITLTVVIHLDRIPTIEQTRLPTEVVGALKAGHGLIIFSGPIGSGKTTSALSLVDHFNRTVAGHICTIENPISVPIPPRKALVQQREVGTDVPDCLAGMRAAFSQDLDLLWVGELAGIDELQACILGAETGHLVITQINATTVGDALGRILDTIPRDLAPTMLGGLARVLSVVTCQRLVPLTAGGRTALFEWMVFDPGLRARLAQGERLTTASADLPHGCCRFDQDAQQLLAEGLVRQSELQAVLHSIGLDQA